MFVLRLCEAEAADQTVCAIMGPVLLQEELEALAAESTTLDDAAVILSHSWRAAAFQTEPMIVLVHAGVPATVLLGLRLRIETYRLAVKVPWTGTDAISPYPSLPADLRMFGDAISSAAAVMCVLPTSPELWWTAWIAGSIAAHGKPAALVHLPDGYPRRPEDPHWWLRGLPYLRFADSDLVKDVPWIHASEAAYVHMTDWIRGRAPYVR